MLVRGRGGGLDPGKMARAALPEGGCESLPGRGAGRAERCRGAGREPGGSGLRCRIAALLGESRAAAGRGESWAAPLPHRCPAAVKEGRPWGLLMRVICLKSSIEFCLKTRFS